MNKTQTAHPEQSPIGVRFAARQVRAIRLRLTEASTVVVSIMLFFATRFRKKSARDQSSRARKREASRKKRDGAQSRKAAEEYERESKRRLGSNRSFFFALFAPWRLCAPSLLLSALPLREAEEKENCAPR
jgi:hypothetical protein